MLQLKLVDKNSKEAEFAKSALFSKHAEMKGIYKNWCISNTSAFIHFFWPLFLCLGWLTDWPEDHSFQFFKLEIENIFLIDWFGGPKPLTLDQYLNTSMWVIEQ